MLTTSTLMGGPPWGLRISSDDQQRPVVCKMLPGGRANVAGVRLGDIIQTINDLPVQSVEEAYKKVSESKDLLTIGVIRTPEGYHQTVRKEKLSNSAHNSPYLSKKGVPAPSSVTSSPNLPRSNSFHTQSPIRQIRLDLEGIKGATQNRRQFFEQICLNRSPATDRLLQRKIQMGFQQGLPSESTTTGYDSVCADFAGGSISDIHSGRSTPNSFIHIDDTDKPVTEHRVIKTLEPMEESEAIEQPAEINSLDQMRITPATSSDWAMRAEIKTHNPAEGDVEVPGRRSVAALRQAITDKLEMKAPTGPPRPKTPSSNLYMDVGETPTWKASNIKVFEGFDDNKPYLGRVLDGPVPPTKYFQGVPPPSYHLAYSPHSVEPHSKPPLPPVVPPKPNKAVTIHESGEELGDNRESVQYEPNSFLNTIARNSNANGNYDREDSYYNAPLSYIYDNSSKLDIVNGNNISNTYNIDNSPAPSQSSQSASYNTVVPSKPIISTAIDDDPAPQAKANEQNTQKGNQTASDYYHSLYEPSSELQVNEIPPQNTYSNTYTDNHNYTKSFPDIECSSSINDPRIEHKPPSGDHHSQAPMSTSCMTFFDDDDVTTSQVSYIHKDEHISPDSPPEDPKCSPRQNAQNKPRRQSMDLEMSELLKSRSPAPFGSYSSNSGDHYATLRRSQYSPVTPLLSTPSSDVASPPAQKSYTFTNDSGFAETPSFKDTSFDSSSMHSTQREDGTFSVMSSDSRRPDSLMSYSTEHHGTAPYSSAVNPATVTPSSHPHSHPAAAAPVAQAAGSASALSPDEQLVSGEHSTEHKPPTEDEILLRQQRIAEDDTEQMAEMSSWYRNMFKKMHRLDDQNESVLRYQLREQAPTSSNISRPITPTSFVSRPPSRFECEITPRRAKSVGRVVEPSASTSTLAANRSALERAKTPHFHLPTYKFRHEDSRACVCGGAKCLRCGQPRKELSWNEIDYLYKTLGEKEMCRERKNKRILSNIATRCITDRLDTTAKELEEFIEQLDISWKRSNSSPMINYKHKEKPSSTSLANEIAELKRISKEEMMYRQKAERLTEELEQERQRRHGFIPSASPALQKNFDRFEGLINNYSNGDTILDPNRPPGVCIQTATALYKFVAKSPRELSLNKGDIVRINREVDANWMEGERNGKVGIFPTSYVQIEQDVQNKSKNKMRAVYPFTARNSNEMSLKIGEIIIYRRDIDSNWAEGSNHIGEIGIFPKSYVRPIDDVQEPPAVIPDRPKTPKIGAIPTFEIEYESPPREVNRDALRHDEREVPREPQHDTYRQAEREVPREVPREIPRQIPREANLDAYQQVEREVQREIHRDAQREIQREVPIDVAKEVKDIPRDFKTSPAANNVHFEKLAKSLLEGDPHSFEEKPHYKSHNEWKHEPEQVQQQANTFHQKPQLNFTGLANLIPRGSETYRALFAYKPQKDDELELEVDDIIFVVEKCDDGWYIGTLLRNGKFGTFPGNYVQKH